MGRAIFFGSFFCFAWKQPLEKCNKKAPTINAGAVFTHFPKTVRNIK